jgi:hypothetical protein
VNRVLLDRSLPAALFGISLGMTGLLRLHNRALGVGLLVASALWWLVAERRKQLTDAPLPERVLRLANDVRRAAPGGWREAPLRLSSNYGLRATVTRHLGELSQPQRLQVLAIFRRRRYSERLHRRAVALVEELAAGGLKDPTLGRVVTGRPARDELADLAISLRSAADKAAGIDAPLGS